MAIQALLPYAPAITKGLTAGLRYIFRPKRRVTTTPFAETTYGKLLKKREETGLYPPSVRGKMLRRYGETIGSGTQKEKAGITGGLVRRGMWGSVSGLKALGEPERRRTGLLGEYGRELDIESEMSKQRAEEEYARLVTMTEEQRRIEEEQRKFQESQAKWGLLGGLGEAGLTGYRGYRLSKLMDTGLEPYAKAAEAGIDLPYYAGRGLLEGEKAQSDEIFISVYNRIKYLISIGKREEAMGLFNLIGGGEYNE